MSTTISHYTHPNPHNPRLQPPVQPPFNTQASGSYSMMQTGASSYNLQADPYGSPAPRGSNIPPRYPCLFQGCPHTSARPYDLNRHQKTHFPETVAKLDCPLAKGGFCGREGERGFTREDHRKEHVRNVHPVKR